MARRRRKGIAARSARVLRLTLRIALVLLVIDLAYLAIIWPDWKALAGGPIPKSNFMRIYRRNHPFDRISTHPMFFNKGVGLLNEDSIADIESNPLLIGHDVWIGHETVITPKCRVLRDGCVIRAGAIVTRDVEPFTIVGGNPARLIRRRFSEDVEKALRESEWWLPLRGGIGGESGNRRHAHAGYVMAPELCAAYTGVQPVSEWGTIRCGKSGRS